MLKLTDRAADVKARTICSHVKGITRAALQASTLLVRGPVEADVALKRMGAPGCNYATYGQNLAACVWRFNNISKEAERVPTMKHPSRIGKSRAENGQFAVRRTSLDPFTFAAGRYLPLSAHHSGTAKGIDKLTGDGVDTLLLSPALQRYRVHQIARAVQKSWPQVRTNSGSKVADPYRSPALASAREDAVGHQLCEWAKAKFRTTIKLSKMIAAGKA
jgi:hypothetical protein